MFRIIKVGGKLIENDIMLGCLCDKLSACSSGYILVHGGGSMAGQLSSRLGIVTRMHDGRRITDGETLEVTVMVYAGLANKKMVAALQARGVDACGLSGCDMGIVRAHKRKAGETDWGFVGDIDEVRVDRLISLLGKQIVPVLSPITFDRYGQLLNTNADSVAAAVAISLSRIYETELVFCLDKPGVLTDIEDEHSVIPVLDPEKYQDSLDRHLIHSGMIPKLENAFKTIEAGVKMVRLTNPGNLEGGTVIKMKNEE